MKGNRRAQVVQDDLAQKPIVNAEFKELSNGVQASSRRLNLTLIQLLKVPKSILFRNGVSSLDLNRSDLDSRPQCCWERISS